MKVATPRQHDDERQGFLFDPGIGSVGSARTKIGDHFERLARDYFGATRLRCSAAYDICPDLEFAPKDFGEVKSAGVNNQLIIYQERLKVYDLFCLLGNKLRYVVFNHDVKVSELSWLEDLRLLTARLKNVYVISAAALHLACLKKKPRAVNKSHPNKKYHFGWTIQVVEIQQLDCEVIKGDELRKHDRRVLR